MTDLQPLSSLRCPSCEGAITTCLGCGARVDLLRLAGPTKALLSTPDGLRVMADPSPRHPVIYGLSLTPAVIDALQAANVACDEHAITLHQLLERATAALASWPSVLASYELPSSSIPAHVPDCECDGMGCYDLRCPATGAGGLT